MIVHALLIMLLQANWSPPSRQMPAMPLHSELNGGWRTDCAPWFAGLGEDLSEVRLTIEGGRGQPSLARFANGPRTVETWSDRNGDGRADMIEIDDANGARSLMLIDSDFDGRADLLRRYSGGAVQQEQRF